MRAGYKRDMSAQVAACALVWGVAAWPGEYKAGERDSNGSNEGEVVGVKVGEEEDCGLGAQGLGGGA